MLRNLVLLASALSSLAAPTTSIERRRRLAQSIDDCEHGSDGVMIELDELPGGPDKMAFLMSKLGLFTGIDVRYKLRSINTVAARLPDTSIDALLHDSQIKSVTASHFKVLGNQS